MAGGGEAAMTLASTTYRISESFFGDAEGFYNGSSSVSALVPGAYDVALDGRPYMLDNNPEDLYRVPRIEGPSSIPASAAQQDTSATPGQQSLNRQDVWRMSFASWSHGAGQTWFDRSDSDPFRFRTSRGVDVWTKYRMSLLPDTTSAATASTGFAWLGWVSDITGGSKLGLYVLDGTVVKRLSFTSADVVTNEGNVTGFTGTAGGFTQTQRGLTSDGNNGYAIDTAGGTDTQIVKIVHNSASTWTTATGGVLRGVNYVKGRLVAWGATVTSNLNIWDMSATGTKATPTATLPSVSGAVGGIQDVTGGSAAIYVLATYFNNAPGTIYKLTPDPSTSALTVITEAGTIPTGETAYAIFGYSGFVCIGTSRGFRIAAENSDGSLQVGALVDLGVAVKSFNAIGRFVYFGWSAYDSSSSGIGKIDLSVFTNSDDLVPAYASDLMAASQGVVSDIVVFDNGAGTVKPYFSTTDKLWSQASTPVASGMLTSGYASYGIADPKTAVGVIVRTEPLNGAVVVSLTNAAAGTSATVDTLNVAGSTGSTLTVRNVVGSEFELTFTLTPSGAVAPAVTTAVLLSRPAPASGQYWSVPLLLAEDLMGNDKVRRPMDVWAELRHIRSLRSPSTTPVNFQIGNQTFTVFVDDYQNHPHHTSHKRDSYSSTCVVILKDLTGVVV